jgi:hypothetical protein
MLSWGNIIEDHAKNYPEHIAIKFEDQKITFKEQNELINQYVYYHAVKRIIVVFLYFIQIPSRKAWDQPCLTVLPLL